LQSKTGTRVGSGLVRAHPGGFATFVLTEIFISLGRQRRTNYFNHKPFDAIVN
jgi:hypothetical protein